MALFLERLDALLEADRVRKVLRKVLTGDLVKNGDELERMYVGSLRRAVEGDVDNGTIMSGQIAAVVHERKSAKEVIAELMSEAEALGGCTLQQMADANAERRRLGL